MTSGVLIGCDADLQPTRTIPALGELQLTGWAVAASGVSGVVVTLGSRVFHATYGLDSPYAVDSFPDVPAAERAGWALRVPLTGKVRSVEPVIVSAFDAEGGRADLHGLVETVPFDFPAVLDEDRDDALDEGLPVMWCIEPSLVGGGALSPDRTILGWAVARDGIEEVSVYIDGNRLRALHGLARPELRRMLGDDLAASAGFALRLDELECPPGKRDFAVVACGRDGRCVGLRDRIDVLSDEEWDERREAAEKAEVDEDLTSERYVPERHKGSVISPEHEARYRWAARAVGDKVVLDAGCGTGWGTAILAAAAPSRTAGVDRSEHAVKHARSQGLDDAEFVVGDLRAIPYPDSSFDVVTCFEAIEHVAEVEQALDELKRVLRPGGLLLISTPNRGTYPSGNPHHLHEFTASEFAAALRGRFPEVLLMRQETHVTSVLAGDELARHDDVSKPIDVEVRKNHAVPPGEELYVVAAASSEKVPDLGEIAVIGGALALKQMWEETAAWEDRAILAESHLAMARVDLDFVRRAHQDTLKGLRSITRDQEAREAQPIGPQGNGSLAEAGAAASQELPPGTVQADPAALPVEDNGGDPAVADPAGGRDQAAVAVAAQTRPEGAESAALVPASAAEPAPAEVATVAPEDLAQLTSRLAQAEGQIEAVRSSRSWKLTSPIRLFGRMVRDLRRG